MAKCIIRNPNENYYVHLDPELNYCTTESAEDATVFEDLAAAHEALTLLGKNPQEYSCPPVPRKPRKPAEVSRVSGIVREVAKAAEVSEPTVYKALVNPNDVRKECVLRIFQAFEDMGITFKLAEIDQ